MSTLFLILGIRIDIISTFSLHTRRRLNNNNQHKRYTMPRLYPHNFFRNEELCQWLVGHIPGIEDSGHCGSNPPLGICAFGHRTAHHRRLFHTLRRIWELHCPPVPHLPSQRAHPVLNQGPAGLRSAALTTELCTHDIIKRFWTISMNNNNKKEQKIE